MNKIDILKVSSKSNPNSIAGAIAGTIREFDKVGIEVIGAGALNQAIKAIAIARGFLAPSGIDLACMPSFTDVDIEYDGKVTGIKLDVFVISK